MVSKKRESHPLFAILELKTPEARYREYAAEDYYFAIDCGCRGKNKKYSGSHYEIGEQSESTELNLTQTPDTSKYTFATSHTFYLDDGSFVSKLYDNHREKIGQSPLVIVCNDCNRRFPFTHESYLKLRDKMMDDYESKEI